ncbi:recombinase family protein [Streptomyces sp. NBC_00140]|uniref:recombinase family protein n=1 Tax=Streptomyces sp. NBC_00140 TaxID=2975664 RepID=UPI002254A292|nr:recombinase family protein [Streptomyces sp. NBC_00140]MCX5333538.1 recombinase family protein [Streptomyces sp. NBC_00140]
MFDATAVPTPGVNRGPESAHAVRAALMLWVSTHEQARGYGLDAQESACRAYVAGRSGWSLAPELVFRDEGVSGATVDRPGMLRLQEVARQGLIDVIVVHRFDRIGRTGRAFWTWVWAMEDLGVSFASVAQDIDTTTELGRQQLQFHALMAEAERNLIRERTQGGRQLKALEGGWVGGPPPWGYAIEQTGKRGCALIVNESEADVVRTAVALIVDEQQTISQAAQELNALGKPTRSGRPWTASNLHRRLRSPALLKGEVLFRDPAGSGKNGTKLDRDGVPLHGDSVAISVPRIISEERAQALVAAMRETGQASRATAGDYPLSGRILGECGHRYVGAYRKSNDTRYYRCAGGNNGRGRTTNCADPYLTADDVEAAVWTEVVTLLTEPKRLPSLMAPSRAVRPGDTRKQRERVARFEESLQEKEGAAARAMTELAAVPGLDQTVKDAAVRQLAEDVRSARHLLAQAREVLEEQEEAEPDLGPSAGKELRDLTLSEVGGVIGLLDITVKPIGEVRKRSGVKCKVTEWHERTGTPVPAEVPEQAWPAVEELVRDYFRRRQFARGAVDVRTQVNGILYRLRTGCLWDELPARFGPWALAKDRQNTWFTKGFWPVLMDHLNSRGQSSPVRRELLAPPLRVTAGVVLEPAKHDTPSCL